MVAPTRPTSTRVRWWVNQGGTYADERSAGYIFARQRSTSGHAIPHHETLTELQPGDGILHYSDRAIQAVSWVRDRYRIDRRPIPWRRDSDPDRPGYLVRVDYYDAEDPVALREIPLDWRVQEERTGPFERSGDVKQGYLFPVSPKFAEHIFTMFGSRLTAMTAREDGAPPVAEIGAAEEQGFGVPYSPADDREPAEEQLPQRVADLVELDRATRRHMELQDRLATELQRHGIAPRSPGSWQPQFDLAFEHAGQRWVIEVKTTDPVSAQQIRLGLGQVLEYRHRLSGSQWSSCERSPPAGNNPRGSVAGDCQDLGVVLIAADRLPGSLTDCFARRSLGSR